MWIKICGVTRTEDVVSVVNSGADAIGFNFYSRSKRFVSISTASALADAARQMPTDATVVDLIGVFVNSEPDIIRKTTNEVGLNAIQIHGDESVEHISQIHDLCPEIPIIRAIRVGESNIERVLNEIDLLSVTVPLTAILLDALIPGEFGGTGTTINLSILHRFSSHQDLPLILAGGLTPRNVARSIDQLAIWGIDTASGVELSPGIKDSTLVSEFVCAARAASAASGGQFCNSRIGESL
jgi:phosphoribosylanthranilate isomerase